jgi:hypothetical protein
VVDVCSVVTFVEVPSMRTTSDCPRVRNARPSTSRSREHLHRHKVAPCQTDFHIGYNLSNHTGQLGAVPLENGHLLRHGDVLSRILDSSSYSGRLRSVG